MRVLSLIGILLLAATGHAAECQSFRDSSYEVVFTARHFALEPIGFSGKVIPQEVYALRCLTAEPDGLSRLRDLIAHGTIVGQLYALAALRSLDAAEFARALPRYTSNTEKVVTISGDLMNQQTVAALADIIARGEYSKKLYPGSDSSSKAPPVKE